MTQSRGKALAPQDCPIAAFLLSGLWAQQSYLGALPRLSITPALSPSLPWQAACDQAERIARGPYSLFWKSGEIMPRTPVSSYPAKPD